MNEDTIKAKILLARKIVSESSIDPEYAVQAFAVVLRYLLACFIQRPKPCPSEEKSEFKLLDEIDW